MKTFNQKMIWSLFGILIGAFLGYLICAFVSGTCNPFTIEIFDYGWVSNGNNGQVWRQLESRDYAMEGFARFLWVFTILGLGAGGGSFGVYLVGKK